MGDDAVRNRDLFADTPPPGAPRAETAPLQPAPAGSATGGTATARAVADSPSRAVPPVLRVSAFVQSARLLLERNLGLLWIGGEISGCGRAPSGHLYFTLKDATAQVRCVFFRSKAQALGFSLRDGLAVEVRATPSIYDARGEFQLNVDTIRLAGLGALYERFLQRKEALAAAGWFDAGRKRALPAYPRRIGIVTSRRAAALRDVLTTLARRNPSASVIVYPAAVQGGAAAGEIAAAIRLANRHAHVDVLIVCRGGGSLEDLWAFNEESVARAVYESRLPIVSGVGHETDFTICDFVADVRAPTPTGAAGLVVPESRVLAQRLADLRRRFARAQTHHMSNRAQRVDGIARRLVHPAARLAEQATRARDLGRRLARGFAQRRTATWQQIAALRGRLTRELRAPLPQSARLATETRALVRAGRDRLARATLDVERLGAALALLNPEAVLDRGYAIVTASGGDVVSDAQQLRTGDDVRIAFARGHAEATVNRTSGSEQ
ncbi:MAG: exodeoxyribonuclease VII large subunit [Betaproteobacteria bacterium]